MTNSTTFPGTVTATTFVGSGANLTSIPAGQLTGSFSGNTAFDTTTLVIDGTNNRVGAGTATPQKTLEVAGPMRITDGLSNVCDLSMGFVVGDYDTGTKIVASDPGATDYFGQTISLSADGTKMVVGAEGDEGTYNDLGAAYIYTYNGSSWSQQAKIQQSDTAAANRYNRFSAGGVAMSGDGTRIIVGVPSDDTGAANRGAAYIFVFSSGSWSQEAKLTGGTDNTANFGSSVAINDDGTQVFVGEPGANPDDAASAEGLIWHGSRNGSTWQTYGQGTTFTHDNPSTGSGQSDWLGRSKSGLVISKDATVVASYAYMYRNPGNTIGNVYIFKYNGSSWSQQAVLTGNGINEYFGEALALSDDGTTLVVGKPGGSNASVYIYTYDGSSWSDASSRVELAHGLSEPRDFGVRVAINGAGTRVVVGARSAIVDTVYNTGSAYIFNYNGTSWVLDKKYLSADLQASDAFGRGIAMSRDGSVWAAGATDEDTGGSSAGAAYVFRAPLLNALASSTLISAAGTTLSFTGQHMCVPQGPMSPGLVVSANKNRYVSLNGTLTTGVGAIRSSESLPVVSLSNVVSDRSVFGVVDRLEQGGTTERRQVVGATVVTAQKELGDTRVIVNSLGEGAIWVANTNGNLVSGDYITTSHLTGYGQKQDVENLQNSTVAKITMDCDFNPDDVPIQVIKKNDTGNNDLDPYGRIQWEDHPSKTTQKAYVIRYLTVDGSGTDEANAVHRTAFVGCTYHCG